MSHKQFEFHQLAGEGVINAQAFSDWHDQYRERLLNSMTALVRDRDTAEDVTAAALATAWRNWNRFRGESNLYTWIHAIALNEARLCLRRNRAVALDSFERSAAEELREPGNVADALEHSESCNKLRKALRQIPAVYRRTLVDHCVRGYPVKRIAQRDRIPYGTVLSRIFAAKRMLRAAWEA